MLMRLLTSPFMPYIAGAMLLSAAFGGWKVRDWQCDAAYAAALEKAQKQRDEMQEKLDGISASYEAERDQANVVVGRTTREIREIYKTAPAVPVSCAVDPRVVGMLESSLDSANAAAAGKSGK